MNLDFQARILDEILKKYNKKSEAVEELSTLLEVGKDAIYRRMRGDSILTPYEIYLLSERYKISLDSLVFEKTDTVFFTYNSFSRKITNFNQYLEGVLQNLEVASRLPDCHLDYASMEIPAFHYFYSPQLTAFKLYVWGLTTWDFDFLKDEKFSFGLIAPDNYKITGEITKLYNQLPSTELYSLNIVDNTLNHIEYVTTINGFKNPEDALLLCDEVSMVMNHARKMAEEGMKFSPNVLPVEGVNASYNLFHNELVSTNNTFLIKSQSQKLLFTTFGNPNFLATTDQRICDFTEVWLQKTINKSNPLSMHSEKNREWFFNRIEKRIKNTRMKIELSLGE